MQGARAASGWSAVGSRGLFDRLTRLDALSAGAVCVVSAIAVFHRLDISAWFDETFSFGMATQSWSSLAHWAWGAESNMLLYYLILKGWLALLSLAGAAPNEWLLRLPSAVFAVAAAALAFMLGRRLFGATAGFVAGFIYAVNFLQMILAQNARAYSLQLMLLTLSWLLLFTAIEKRRPVWWAAYVAASVLAVYAALMSGLVLVAQVAALGALLVAPGPWRSLVRKAWRPIILSLAAALALIVPIGVDAALHGGPTWVLPADTQSVRLLLNVISGSSHAYAFAVFGAAGLGVLLAAAVHHPTFARLSAAQPEALGFALAMVMWIAVPAAISFALTQPWLNLHLFYARYLVVIVPPICLLAGLAVASLPGRVYRVAAAAVLVVIAVRPLGLYYQVAQVQDFKDPVRWLADRYEQGDGIVCDPEVECAIPVTYYLLVDGGPAHLDADSPGEFSWSTAGSVPVSADSIRAYESGHSRIFFVFGPLGRSRQSQDQAGAMQKLLIADGYHEVATTTGQGSAVDETVTLFTR